MKSFANMFFTKNQFLICERHRQQITKICCNLACVKQKQHLLCSHKQCLLQHSNHPQIPFESYKQLISYIQNQIIYKKQIKSVLSQYKRQILDSVNNIFQKIQKQVDQYLDKRCSSKYLIEIQKKFNYEEHFQQAKKFDFYKQFINNFPKIQTINTRKFVSANIVKKIKLLSKKSLKNFTSQYFGLDETIFPDQEINQIREYSKQEKLKQLLPFKCQLNLKFKGSQHKFLSSRLYATDIRGPIIIIIQSHKNRIFGGYSPVMFPKTQQYIQDNKLQCFLFSLDDKCILPIKQEYRQYSIRGGKNFWFGRGDLAVSDECQKGNISWAEIGRAYKAPALAYGNQSYWLAGAWYFRVLQYEIFEVDIESLK